MTFQKYFIENYKAGRFDRLERGAGVFDLKTNDYRNFPELKGTTQILVRKKGGKLAVEKKQLKKNIEGFVDAFGIFHPIRSGNKEQGRLYDGQIAGDDDDVFDKAIRRNKNEQKANEIYEKRMMDDALDSALGENRKISLSQFVRNSGGLKYDPKNEGYESGELRKFSFKESRRKGIAHKNGKKSLDYMREAAAEAGYSGLNGSLASVNDFIDALDADLSGSPIYPFGGETMYNSNPATAAVKKVYQAKAKQLKTTIDLLRKNKKTAKANKLEKVYKLALQFAAAAKKTVMPKKNAAKINPKNKKNSFASAISTLANVAVGTSAALDVHSRMKRKQPVKKTPPRKVAKPKQNRDLTYHESAFAGLLDAIENGDFTKINAAKLQGKLAGFAKGETDILIQRARLTHKLKTNPTAANIKAGDLAMLKQNGIFSRYRERRKAGKFLKRQLKLEYAIDKAKEKLAIAKKAAVPKKARKKKETVSNPAKPKLPRRNSASYEAFQGRESTKTLELITPETAPRNLYCLGVLFELKVKGIAQPVNYRRAASCKTYYLCADEKNKQLWIAGGRSGEPQSELEKGFVNQLGEIIHVVYETQKTSLGDKKKTSYIHKFGEEGGARPQLSIDRHGFGIITGGDYEITPLGIRN